MALTMHDGRPALVIGYGNPLRGDDGAGPRVADAIAARALPGVRVLAVPQLVPELAEPVAGAGLVVFVDACRATPGAEVRVERAAANRRPVALGHASDPGTLLALAEGVFGRCPAAWLVRVPAVQFELGEALSAATARGVDAAAAAVARLVTGRLG